MKFQILTEHLDLLAIFFTDSKYKWSINIYVKNEPH
jgi:hypothetical protein